MMYHTRSVLSAVGAALVVAAVVACDAPRSLPTAPVASIETTTARADLAPPSTLLSCPTSETSQTSSTIGMFGGRLQVAGYEVVFPFGAVPEPTKFTLVVPAGPYNRVDIYANDAHGYRFQRPITVSMSLVHCPSAALQSLAVWYVDDANNLLEFMGGTVDLLGLSIQFSTPHLSGYSVAYRSGEPSDSTGEEGAR